ncbi:hypothetical protein HWV62_9561 [Athelia sp. TMB]|nr:hypothetical protein HWV62_9561 [Athelia sp. TMB]
MSPSWLFPIAQYEQGFTTAGWEGGFQNITHIPLADKPLGVHKSGGQLPHNVVFPPPPLALADGETLPQLAWESFFPQGSINPAGDVKGGFGFYLTGPPGFAARLETATEALFSYKVMFEDGFEWVKGGKLPGAFGGVGDASYRCSGGRQDDRCKCFSLRLMWRANGRGEIYSYIPLNQTNEDRMLEIPLSHKNPDFGFSVGRGAFSFPKGVWTTVAERVKLNTIGQADGEVELWINGTSIVTVKGLILREDAASHIKGAHFQTFFGGMYVFAAVVHF